ncbi:peptidylprolyl isomerase [Paramagnetospirillum marisnigri]|uniref:peptidylprolyl isomerase n=1 Tax=Paramagnetospirillum marisnigri TaxID=1285242 RepID=A0A178MEK2_9PROT|nr:peptidylprolyl isomerase [Paramagnetospirillum marisnigri]OAN46597.1 peptidylprolyl isomerase [Paramagnetospirillum marisnigri]
MSTLVAKDTVVTLNYMVKDPDGQLIDDGSTPIEYLHGGYDGIFPKIEEALEGKAVGATLKVRLQPDEAFGEYDAELVEVESVDKFPANLQVGMQFEGASSDGSGETNIYRVTDIEDGKAVLDANHPLAGVVLDFECTVAAIRAASAEEVGHGHVHHPGHSH